MSIWYIYTVSSKSDAVHLRYICCFVNLGVKFSQDNKCLCICLTHKSVLPSSGAGFISSVTIYVHSRSVEVYCKMLIIKKIYNNKNNNNNEKIHVYIIYMMFRSISTHWGRLRDSHTQTLKLLDTYTCLIKVLNHTLWLGMVGRWSFPPDDLVKSLEFHESIHIPQKGICATVYDDCLNNQQILVSLCGHRQH